MIFLMVMVLCWWFTRNVEEEKEDTAVKLSRMLSVLTGMLVLLELVVVWLDKLVVGRRTVEIFGRSTDRVGVVRRGGFGGVTNLIWERFWFFCKILQNFSEG